MLLLILCEDLRWVSKLHVLLVVVKLLCGRIVQTKFDLPDVKESGEM